MSSMLAAILREESEALFVEKIPVPKPKIGEVLIRVLSAGICHSDLHVIKNHVKFPRPAVLGHEVFGQVIAVNSHDKSDFAFAEGDLVVTSFIMPCNSCDQCKSGLSNICSSFFLNNRLNGNMLDGTKRLQDNDGREVSSYSMAGFAEYAVVPMSAIVKVRGDLADKSWCVLGCAGITAHSAVKRAIRTRKIEGAPYKTAVIIGVGGVGLFITLFCKILGVENIIAIDVDDKKTDLARDLGATDAFNSAKIDVQEIKAALPGQGAHLVFEAVGSASTIELGFGLVSEGGLITAVGIAPHGTRASFEITPLVRREFTIKGSFGGNPSEDLGAVVKLAEQGLIPLQKIVNQSYSLKEINTAFLNLGKGITRGRSIIDFTSEGL